MNKLLLNLATGKTNLRKFLRTSANSNRKKERDERRAFTTRAMRIEMLKKVKIYNLSSSTINNSFNNEPYCQLTSLQPTTSSSEATNPHTSLPSLKNSSNLTKFYSKIARNANKSYLRSSCRKTGWRWLPWLIMASRYPFRNSARSHLWMHFYLGRGDLHIPRVDCDSNRVNGIQGDGFAVFAERGGCVLLQEDREGYQGGMLCVIWDYHSSKISCVNY
jgi:hypothetical protein